MPGIKTRLMWQVQAKRLRLSKSFSILPCLGRQLRGKQPPKRNKRTQDTGRPEVRKSLVKSGTRVRARHERTRPERKRQLRGHAGFAFCFSYPLLSVAAVQSSGQQRAVSFAGSLSGNIPSKHTGVAVAVSATACPFFQHLRIMMTLCNLVYVYWMYPECILSGIPSVYVTRGSTSNAGCETLEKKLRT